MRVCALLIAVTALFVPAFTSTTTNALSTVQTSSLASSSSQATTMFSSLPTVELNYTTIQAVGGNTTVGYYKYQNIRFAKVPTGDLRFAAPEWPDVETETNTGTNLADADVDCSSNEDCLYLDVWAPANASVRNLSVIVWTYGDGFTGGSKFQDTPEGLFDLSTDFIFVAYNYRLGITGLASGPTYQHEGGDASPCVWDSMHAFEWVQKYISSFGGNPDDVTALGFSAGGLQVLFQMTRFGGNASQLFQKAFVMSPSYIPGVGNHQVEQFWQNVSSAVGCDGGHLDCMRGVEFTNLTDATNTIINEYTYELQPRVDGFNISDTNEGEFNFSGPCVITHEQHEANESADLRFSDIKQSFDSKGKKLAVTHALNNQTWKAEAALGTTHGTDQRYYWYRTYKLSTLVDNTTTTTGSASSGSANKVALMDIQSNFTDGRGGAEGKSSSSTVNATIAVMMQKYLLSFVLTGNPNAMWVEDKIYWPPYNESSVGTQIVFNDTFKVTDT